MLDQGDFLVQNILSHNYSFCVMVFVEQLYFPLKVPYIYYYPEFKILNIITFYEAKPGAFPSPQEKILHLKNRLASDVILGMDWHQTMLYLQEKTA